MSPETESSQVDDVDVSADADTSPPPVTTAAPAAPAQKTLALGDDRGDEPAPKITSKWPDNWREEFADGDEEELKRLKRYNTPAAVNKARRQLEKKLSSGNLKPVRPDTDDQKVLAEWRKSVGVPDTPEGYMEHVLDVDLSDLDAGLTSKMLKVMHEEGIPSREVSRVVKEFVSQQTQATIERMQADADFKSTAEDELRADLGPKYREGMNVMATLVHEFGNDKVKQKLFGGRTSEGYLLGDDPDILKFLINVATAYYPDNQIVSTPSAEGSNVVDTIEKELRDLAAEMADSNDRMNLGSLHYWKNPDKQQRYRDLLMAKEKMDARKKR